MGFFGLGMEIQSLMEGRLYVWQQVQLVALHAQSGSREQWMLVLILLFLQARAQPYGNAPLH